ncbi:hypothetical protein Mp_2g02130 [Marchantia polymorpha subsp. ruderalis]|uniref:Uncharacterized protein n=1 Tax=Marchantia polymorpha TaxID=3197 RepID=A0A2R6W886_MARPO|nr:hypothetical protein MARPO_0130s0021 [Marchantia polymorpha]BBN00789.1 hypothetical protein Mp_2g02130 [Marchantia polymorpha subsp. ruderalis]|eukprot:PTQ30066.1 hypothetical protein MARPO_0130s0021 [Marchantia polymorpha]
MKRGEFRAVRVTFLPRLIVFGVEHHYQAADDKGSFFDGSVPIKNTLLSNFRKESAPGLFQIDSEIVDTIIGCMYFDVDDESDSDEEAEEVETAVCRDGRRRPDLTSLEIKKRALSIFVLVQDFSPKRNAYASVSAYEVAIKNSYLFDMVIKFTSLGSTFRLTSRLAQWRKELTGMACYSGCNRRKVSSFLRMLSNILSNCWAFLLAMDGATHQSTSYLDIRVCFWTGDNIHNFHLLALPMNERHPGKSMFDMVVKVLDVIHPGWRDYLIGVATDGARNMTGRHVVLLTFLDDATGPNFIRLDLIMADVYDNLLKEEFYYHLVSLIGYLRRQQNLIADMKTMCPKVAITCWLFMIKVMSWFKKHRIALLAYLDEKLPPCRPSAAWWVLMMVVHSFAQEASLTFCRLVGAKEASAGSGGLISTREFAAPLSSVEQFVRGLGTFVSLKLDEITSKNGARHHVLGLVGSALLSAALQLTSITAEQNCVKEQAVANDQLPPVMPHELVKYGQSQFCVTVRKHNNLRLIIDACNHRTLFMDGLGLLGSRFLALFEFAGGLASVFPGTSTVEADFSRLKREKDIFSQSLSDFGLECVLHAQQHKWLLQLTTAKN